MLHQEVDPMEKLDEWIAEQGELGVTNLAVNGLREPLAVEPPYRFDFSVRGAETDGAVPAIDRTAVRLFEAASNAPLWKAELDPDAPAPLFYDGPLLLPAQRYAWHVELTPADGKTIHSPPAHFQTAPDRPDELLGTWISAGKSEAVTLEGIPRFQIGRASCRERV